MFTRTDVTAKIYLSEFAGVTEGLNSLRKKTFCFTLFNLLDYFEICFVIHSFYFRKAGHYVKVEFQ